jgi:hypothetical protein
MNNIYHAKHQSLFFEFTNYIITHPNFNIPSGAEVILLDCKDAGYTRYMLKHAPKNMEDVVFIDVGELAPIRSRIKKPKIITREFARKSVTKTKNISAALKTSRKKI